MQSSLADPWQGWSARLAAQDPRGEDHLAAPVVDMNSVAAPDVPGQTVPDHFQKSAPEKHHNHCLVTDQSKQTVS